jgi:HK97 family phage major capsid protein
MDDKSIKRFNELRERLDNLFQKYGTDAPPDVIQEMASLVSDLKAIIKGGDLDRLDRWLNEPLDRPRQPGGGGGQRGSSKTLGELFVQSNAFKGFTGRESPTVELKEFGLKTLLSTDTGFPPEVVRGARVELTPERQLVVADLPTQTQTTQAAVKWMLETTKTPAATEVAESVEGTPGTYPEAAFALEEQTSTVRKIGVFIPITDEQMEDEARCRNYINDRLTRAIRERLDYQLLNGDGSAPNLRGFLNVVGVQTQAKGADPSFDAIQKAITKVRFTGYAEPDGIVLHPNDWQDIRLTRTADGLYIGGSPFAGGPDRLWGLPVAVSPAIAEGTALVGAFRAYSEMAIRKGLEIKVSDAHSTYFIEGKLAVRADFRLAFMVPRPTAFCMVTNI